jgi:hypothetical protein
VIHIASTTKIAELCLAHGALEFINTQNNVHNHSSLSSINTSIAIVSTLIFCLYYTIYILLCIIILYRTEKPHFGCTKTKYQYGSIFVVL